MSRARLRGVIAVAVCALCALVPSAASATFMAAYHAECCSQTLESGEMGSSWFEFTNAGSSPWTPGSNVRLGTSTPQGGTVVPNPPDSPFYVPGHWISPKRPVGLDGRRAIYPGQIGRFTFPIKAPPVSAPTIYRQYFEPLAEGIAWMKAPVFLDYTVLPSQAPTIRFTAAPAAVYPGDPIRVTAAAADNRVVDHVTFSLGGVTRTVARPTGPYATILGSGGVALGAHRLVATAVDGVGNSTQAIAVFAVVPRPDTDRDGLTDASDRCPTRRAGRYDRDHDGCPGPYRKMTLRIVASWSIPDSGVQLTGLALRGVPRRGKVRADCRRCHVHEAHRLRAGKSHTVRLSSITGPRLPSGAVIVIRITAPGYIGRYLRYVVREHGSSIPERLRVNKRPFRRSSHCMPAGRSKPAKSCPIRP